MTAATLSTTLTLPARHKENPLGLFIASIREKPNLSEDHYKREFVRLLSREGYEDFVEEIVREWMNLKFSTALSAAFPPTREDIKNNLRQKKLTQAQEQREANKAVDKAKALLGYRLLELVCPNGKMLRDCTGSECRSFGGFYARLANKVPPGKKVGNVLDEAGLVSVFKDR